MPGKESAWDDRTLNDYAAGGVENLMKGRNSR